MAAYKPNGQLVCVFRKGKDAARFFGVTPASVVAQCKRKVSSKQPVYFRYA